MSTQAKLRRMVAEITGDPGGPTVARVGPRTIHQYWHLLAPSFRGVLLTPHRRVGEAGTSWTWHEAGEGEGPTSAELESVRRRLAAAYELFFESGDHDEPRNDDDGAAFELRLAIEDVVNALKACDDGRLAGYVCRTDAGLFVHSWGVTPPARPREVTDTGERGDGAASSVRDEADDRSGINDTQSTVSRRGRRRLVVFLALLFLLGSAAGGARWFWQQRGRRLPAAAPPPVGVVSGAAPNGRGEIVGAVSVGPAGGAGAAATLSRDGASFDPQAMSTGAMPAPVPTETWVTARPSSRALPSTAWRTSDGEVGESSRGTESKPAPRTIAEASAGVARPTRQVARADDDVATPSNAINAGADSSASLVSERPPVSRRRDGQSFKEPRGTSDRLPGDPSPLPLTKQPNRAMEASATDSEPRATGERSEARSSPERRARSAAEVVATVTPSSSGLAGSLPGGGANGTFPALGAVSAEPSGTIAAGVGASPSPERKTYDAPNAAPRVGAASPDRMQAVAEAGGAAASLGASASLAGGSVPASPAAIEAGDADELSSEALAADDAARETEAGWGNETPGSGSPGPVEPREALPGWSARRTVFTISVPQLRLLRDAILPTEPGPAGRDHAEEIARLREQLWREREAQIPEVLARPGRWHGCAIELPPGAGNGEWRWTARGDGRTVRSMIAGMHAELTWPAEGLLQPEVFVLRDSAGAPLAQVELKAAGEFVIWGAPLLQVWPWVAVEAPEAGERFRWRDGGAVPRPRLEGERLRIDARPFGPAKTGAAAETAVLEDTVSGWALVVEIEQTTHEPIDG